MIKGFTAVDYIKNPKNLLDPDQSDIRVDKKEYLSKQISCMIDETDNLGKEFIKISNDKYSSQECKIFRSYV